MLAACGGEKPESPGVGGSGGAGGGNGAAAPAGRNLVRADTDPWPDDPAGPAWEACGWVPQGDKGELSRFDWRTLRTDPAPWRSSGAWFDGVEARRTWV